MRGNVVLHHLCVMIFQFVFVGEYQVNKYTWREWPNEFYFARKHNGMHAPQLNSAALPATALQLER